jgi:uncharacterized protein
VIIPDVNLLLYAEIDAYPVHEAARRWWETTLIDVRPVGIPPVCLFGFLRLSTSRKVFEEPLTADDALGRAHRWLEQPNVAYLTAGTRHLEIASKRLRQLGTAGNLTTDVQIAAHALELGGEVYSNDRDFGRFSELRWVNPLET